MTMFNNKSFWPPQKDKAEKRVVARDIRLYYDLCYIP